MSEIFSPKMDLDKPNAIEVSNLCDEAKLSFDTSNSLRGDLAITYLSPHGDEKYVSANHSTEPSILATLLIRLVQGPIKKNPIELFDEIVQAVFPDQNIPEDTEIDNTYKTRQWVNDMVMRKIDEVEAMKDGLKLNAPVGRDVGLILRYIDDGIAFFKISQKDSEDVWSEDTLETDTTSSTTEFEETEAFKIYDADLTRVAIAVTQVGLFGRAKELIIPTLRGLTDS